MGELNNCDAGIRHVKQRHMAFRDILEPRNFVKVHLDGTAMPGILINAPSSCYLDIQELINSGQVGQVRQS